MKKRKSLLVAVLCLLGFALASAQIDPDTAQHASIDRFSMSAGNLFVRDSTNGLPGPNAPVDFDQAPFITKGLGPNGELVAYYNFDVQSTTPAPIYVLFRDGESMPVPGQLNIVGVIPGDAGYNDIWNVQKVTVPANYVANTVTSVAEIISASYPITPTTVLVNCPIVPDNSTAGMRWNHTDYGLARGWYEHKVVYYFNFSERSLSTNAMGMVPVSPIYVSFNINPGQPGGGPPSGFMTDAITGRTHNVTATIPTDTSYSPMWTVNVYDNADFANVHDLTSALNSSILATGVAIVNCPMVAQYQMVDRFSSSAGHLFIRDSTNNLPGPNAPVNYDVEPFISMGFGPDGEHISYYNFDVQPTDPAPIYVLFNSSTMQPVEGQHNIIDVVPGDSGYNDFWEVTKVMVPADYEANSVTSLQEILNASYPIVETTTLVNCPVISEGSTASMRLNGGSPDVSQGWYKDKVVTYFNFSEHALMTDQSDMVPLSPIYVSFNINPGSPGGGPPSGFMTDSTGRTHNVTATVPADSFYSPLWRVNIYDNADFNSVHDLASAQAANILVMGAANVNCPIVAQGPTTSVKEDNTTLPSAYSLSQNYPNPFNPSTQIKFSIVANEHVSVRVYNTIGQEVARLVNDVLPAGNYSVRWDAANFSSGVYFYTITTNNFHTARKMILLK
jgi:Secretion system C-terminal sorting domain